MKQFLALPLLTAALAFSACQANPVLEAPASDPAPDRAILLALPDVAVTKLTVDNYTSTRIYYSYTLANQGSASINLSAISLQASISTDAVLSSGDWPAGGFVAATSGTLAPGASYSGSFSATPGAGVIQPERTLFLKATCSVLEAGTANNLRSTPIYLRWVDFIVPSGSAVLQTNGYIQTTVTVKNNGLQAVLLSGVNVALALSADSVWGGADVAAGGYALGPITGKTELLPGEAVTVSFATSKPAAYNPGVHKFILFKADANNACFEVDETNNVLAKAFP